MFEVSARDFNKINVLMRKREESKKTNLFYKVIKCIYNVLKLKEVHRCGSECL